MSMARDITDASPWPNSVRGSGDASSTHSMAVHRGPSRRNSRRALTERALAEGAARTRSKIIRARESRMSITSNGGTSSPSGFSIGMRQVPQASHWVSIYTSVRLVDKRQTSVMQFCTIRLSQLTPQAESHVQVDCASCIL